LLKVDVLNETLHYYPSHSNIPENSYLYPTNIKGTEKLAS